MKAMFLSILLIITASSLMLFAQDKPTPAEPLYHESLRPQFHFTARYWDEYQLNPPNHHEGWINDINGLVYNAGEYHFFAQRWWSAWLHAISADLIHWTEYKPAFGKGGKFGGTQSGGGVVDVNNTSGLGDGKTSPMLAFWTSTDNLNQCMSYSLDKGRTWKKYENNPILVHKFRDPKVFWYEPDQKWVMILYGPSDSSTPYLRYGFNGEENDAHDIRKYQQDEWTCSVMRVFEDGKVTVTDQNGTSNGRIDPKRENLSNQLFTIAAKADKSEFLTGDIAEILVYDRPLTDEQTQATIKAMLSSSGNKYSAENLKLHVNSANALTDASGKVTQLTDLSGQNNHLSQADTQYRPTLIKAKALGNRPVMHFDGTQYLNGPAPLVQGDDDFTIIALWRRDQSDNSQVICEQNTPNKKIGQRAALLTLSSEFTDNAYLMFTSKNLLDWTKLDVNIPDSYECPDMFELPVDNNPNEKKWVIIDGNGDYVLGNFDGQQFTTETKKKKGDYGRNFYATMSFENMPQSDPRRIQLAWMRGWDDYPKNMPFNQQVSFPCELTLRHIDDELILCRYPIREISIIHTDSKELKNQTIKPNQNPLAGIDGELFDINLKLNVAKSTCSSITLLLCGNTVTYDLKNHTVNSVGSTVPLLPRDGMITLRILIDRLSLETYGNHGEVSITNIAFQKNDGLTLNLEVRDGSAIIPSLTVHKVESIWK